MDEFEQIIKTFAVESVEGLEQMEELLIGLESNSEDEEIIPTIFRVAHTIKGNAASLGYQPLSDFAHAMEDTLAGLRSGEIAVTKPLISLLLQGVDVLRELVASCVAGHCQSKPEHEVLQNRLKEVKGGQGAIDVGDRKTSLDPTSKQRKAWGRRKEDLQDYLTGAKSIRVDIHKLDRMLDLSGEIAIAQGRLRQQLEEKFRGSGQEVREIHDQTDRLFNDLQKEIMQVRMVPIGPMLRQFIRMVRDAAERYGKMARLSIEGEDVEVDTTVIEHLKDPITHMVRNALDHGLEAPEIRKARGKNPCGQITLRAYHYAGSIMLELEDDGSGFQKSKILNHAIAMGLVSEAGRLSEEDIYGLVFESGFSTADSVTDLSGRGVGMDVVKRNIEVLRGSIGIRTREGSGSTVTIRLPLTLAIIDGFVVGVGEETYVVPLEAVTECLAFPDDVRRPNEGQGMMMLRGETLPYIRLRDFFHVTGAVPSRENLVVVRHIGGRMGIVVDRLLGEKQAVIKPLGGLFKGLSGLSGATILADGRVALILDVPNLLRRVMSVRDEFRKEAAGKE